MNTPSSYTKLGSVSKVPIRLKKLAHGLQQLTESEVETLELLLEAEVAQELLDRTATLPALVRTSKTVTPQAMWKKLGLEHDND